ncbi:MAG TPA: membrane protein insertion efficiency factor YidD [Actinomycetota bacterium]|nr:membrane protein insertion efficiency factor YidD [Actinomycetota bacterium]
MRNPVAVAVIVLIKGYQATLGKIFGGSCRFHPSCSDYALKAVQLNGALVGSGQAVWRVVRCAPWSKGGVDYPKPTRRAKMRAHAAEHRTEAARG